MKNIDKRKILFVASVAGHINVFHTTYLRWFKDNGKEVHVATKNVDKVEIADCKHEINFKRFPLSIENIKAYKKLKEIINKENYSIIHCHTPTAGVLARLAARNARKKGTKVIYTAHGFHFYKGASIFNWLIYYPIEKICSRWTDTLITITQEDYDFAKKKLNKVKQIEHICGVGMNTERFEKDFSYEEKQIIKKELDIKKEDIVFTYVAELNKNKNQLLLIDLIEELKKGNPNIKLLLVGDGALKNQYKEYVQKKNLEDNIRVLGIRKDINEILSITDIYLASSKREGLPVNVMEAMYKGLPVIATDNRGHRELVKNNENGFLVKTREEMKAKIQILLNDNKLKEKMGQKGKIESKKYEIRRVMEDIKKIYES